MKECHTNMTKLWQGHKTPIIISACVASEQLHVISVHYKVIDQRRFLTIFTGVTSSFVFIQDQETPVFTLRRSCAKYMILSLHYKMRSGFVIHILPVIPRFWILLSALKYHLLIITFLCKIWTFDVSINLNYNVIT